MTDFVDVLQAEQRDLAELLGSLSPADWSRPTPAPGWDVRDQVSHLADTEAIARDTVIGGPRALLAEAERHGGGQELIDAGVATGRGLGPAAVLDWWLEATEANCRALRDADVDARVPWGLGMGWRSFVTARLMEHWAHGLEIRAAVGVEGVDTERLEHIARLGWATLPYAFRIAGVEPPSDRTVRVTVTAPNGDQWTFGPDDATDELAGPAGVWCRRAVQRIAPEAATELVASGPLAELALRHARAFL